MRQRPLLVPPYDRNGCEVDEVPTRGPWLSDVERELPPFGCRRIAAVELAPREQLRCMRLECVRKDRELCPFTSDRHGSRRMLKTVTPDADATGCDRRRDQTAWILESLCALDRLGRERCRATVVARKLRRDGAEGGDDEVVFVAVGR